MRQKIIALSVLVTMAHWLGCAGRGGDRSPHAFEDDPARLYVLANAQSPPAATPASTPELTDSEPTLPPAATDLPPTMTDLPTAAADPPPAATELPVARPLPERGAATMAERGGEVAVAQPLPEAAPETMPRRESEVGIIRRGPAPPPSIPLRVSELSENEASLRGMDRTHWPRIVVTPARTRVRHHPIYFEDFDIPTTASADTAGALGASGAARGGVGARGGADATLAGTADPLPATPFEQTGIAASGVVAAPGEPVGEASPAAVGEPAPAGAGAETTVLPGDTAGVGEPLDPLASEGAFGETASPGGVADGPLLPPQERADATSATTADEALSVQRQIEAALSAHPPERYAAGHARALVLQPLKFAADMVLLPVRVVVQPPWTEVTTPPWDDKAR